MSRILVVDSDRGIQRLVHSLLDHGGCHVTCANSAPDGLRLASHLVPDVIVLELDLPGLDGFGCIQRLRGWTQAPIMVLSARESLDDKVRALDAGADDYVVKPFASQEFAARIRVLCRARARGGPAARTRDGPPAR